MRGAIIHGVLLVVMLVYAYRTWTRDKTVEPNVGSVVLWDKPEADIKSIEYKSERKIVKLENRGDYWWGADTTIELRPQKKEEPAAAGSGAGSAAGSGAGSGSAVAQAGSAAGSGAGSAHAGSGAGSAVAHAGSAAGSGAGSGSAAKKPEPPEMEEVSRKTREFPLGDAGDKLVKNYAAARALRDLDVPDATKTKDYKLDDAKTTISVTFKDGSTKTFLVGGSVYGGSDKYVQDQTTKRAYVFSRDLLSSLEIGESALHLTDPRGFDAAKIGSVTINAGDKSRTAVRVTTHGQGETGGEVKTWGEPDTKKPNQTVANFIDNANNLRPVEYASNLKVSDMKQVLKLTYKEERGATLGTLTLYKYEKPGELPPGATLDPANPPKPQTEYYIVTEKTRVPALVRKDTAQRAEQDIDTVFTAKPEDVKSVDPKGNPFGNAPGAPGGGAGFNPHGAPPPVPGMGSAAAVNPHAGMGSAAAVNPHAGTGSAAAVNPHAAPAPGTSATTPPPAHQPPAPKPAAPKAAGSAAAAPAH
ncbi:MAG TPA: DUF4340 domain-containing protein [Kofleriaceae bacterium]|nr:DUF4340 domain-containing protein [Kofleriaceae bacterium]